jgi:hypothetical protein
MKSAQKEKQNVHGRRPGPMIALAQKCRDALSFSDTCAATEYPFHGEFMSARMGPLQAIGRRGSCAVSNIA